VFDVTEINVQQQNQTVLNQLQIKYTKYFTYSSEAVSRNVLINEEKCYVKILIRYSLRTKTLFSYNFELIVVKSFLFQINITIELNTLFITLSCLREVFQAFSKHDTI